jgi:hypothetical protein
VKFLLYIHGNPCIVIDAESREKALYKLVLFCRDGGLRSYSFLTRGIDIQHDEFSRGSVDSTIKWIIENTRLKDESGPACFLLGLTSLYLAGAVEEYTADDIDNLDTLLTSNRF